MRYVFDDAPPKITISSPKNNGTVNGKAATIKGKTQARTTLLARNAANGSSVGAPPRRTARSPSACRWRPGSTRSPSTGPTRRAIRPTATLTVKRGAGKLTVNLSSSTYRIKRSQLPEPVTLSATVTDPDGKALAGADITFTLSIPGSRPSPSTARRNKNGKASWTTTIPKGASVGQGSATALVSTDSFGSTQDFTVITVTK